MSNLKKIINRKKEVKLLDRRNIFFGKLAFQPYSAMYFLEDQYIKGYNYYAFEKTDKGYIIIGDNKRKVYNLFDKDKLDKSIVTDLQPISTIYEDVKVKISELEILDHLEYVADIVNFLRTDKVKQIKR